MPIIDPDQGVPTPAGTDLADNPAAFTNFYTPVLSRLNLRYTDEANRTALHPANIDGEESYLTASNRKELNTGVLWLSAHAFNFFAFTNTQNQTLAASSIALQNVTNQAVALPATGRFGWEVSVFASGVVASDIKFAYTWPGTATAIWGVHGTDTAGTGFTDGTQTTSGNAIALGLLGTSSPTLFYFSGQIVMGGVAGTLQMQAAQNVADVTAPLLRVVRQKLWKES